MSSWCFIMQFNVTTQHLVDICTLSSVVDVFLHSVCWRNRTKQIYYIVTLKSLFLLHLD